MQTGNAGRRSQVQITWVLLAFGRTCGRLTREQCRMVRSGSPVRVRRAEINVLGTTNRVWVSGRKWPGTLVIELAVSFLLHRACELSFDGP